MDEVVKYIKNMNADCETHSESVANQIEREAQKCDTGSGKKGASAADEDDGDEDPMLDAAIELAIESKKNLHIAHPEKTFPRIRQGGKAHRPHGKPRICQRTGRTEAA